MGERIEEEVQLDPSICGNVMMKSTVCQLKKHYFKNPLICNWGYSMQRHDFICREIFPCDMFICINNAEKRLT